MHRRGTEGGRIHDLVMETAQCASLTDAYDGGLPWSDAQQAVKPGLARGLIETRGCALAAYFRKRGRDDYGRGEKVSDAKVEEIGD